MLMAGDILGIELQQVFFPVFGQQGIERNKILLVAGGVGLHENQKVFAGLYSQRFVFLTNHVSGEISGGGTCYRNFIEDGGRVGVLHGEPRVAAATRE